MTNGSKIYRFDLDKIFEYVGKSDKPDTKQTEIDDAYEYDEDAKTMKLSSKVVREVTSPDDTEAENNIKYDLIKMLINRIIYSEDENDGLTNFSYIIPFNTLIQYGFLVEVDN